MFAERKDDCTFSAVLWLSRLSFHSWFQCQCSPRLARHFSPQSSALVLTTATWDAETSGKTVFMKPDWDKSMEHGNSGDRAATSVVPEVMCFQVDCTSDTVKPFL